MTRRLSGSRTPKAAFARQPKYKNCKTTVDGITFDSRKEAARYRDLKMLEYVGAIKALELQPVIKLEINGNKLRYDSGRQVSYKADFRYYDCDLKRYIVEDVKGFRNPLYKLKKAILRAMGVEIIET